mmetsp:Transcript_12526/g.18163  ORF Transcript_12526/g.18163 Transcript_12526/m.18163 type:complete len:140 (-) Transcript_12526:1834-2253(-)
MLDEKPERVGDIVLGDVIGRGASGLVREGHRLNTNEIVAVKCFERDRLSQPRNEEDRIQNEIDVLKSLPAHSGLPKFIDAIHYPKRSSVYLAMEFVAGEQLKTIVENHPDKVSLGPRIFTSSGFAIRTRSIKLGLLFLL